VLLVKQVFAVTHLEARMVGGIVGTATLVGEPVNRLIATIAGASTLLSTSAAQSALVPPPVHTALEPKPVLNAWLSIA